KSEKSSANTETGEDGRAVPAAAKGAIDVGFVFTDVEGSGCFFDKDRDMEDLAQGKGVVVSAALPVRFTGRSSPSPEAGSDCLRTSGSRAASAMPRDPRFRSGCPGRRT